MENLPVFSEVVKFIHYVVKPYQLTELNCHRGASLAVIRDVVAEYTVECEAM
jgi:hypothetical protein